MATELEYKLAVGNPMLLEQIIFDPQIAEVRQNQYDLIAMATIYYDTPDRRLSARCWTLRLRQENDDLIANLKTPGQGRARGEWECPARNIWDAVPQLIALGAPRELDELIRDQDLNPVCCAQFSRRICQIKLPMDTVCDFCADVGLLMGGGREEELCELEIEYKSGDPDMAEAFASELMDRFDLHEETRSKFARANALARG